ncbi:phosphatase PAP2 family protein [Streptomyces sp. NPDC002817]
MGPLLPARLRPVTRPRLWVELAFTALLYWAYTLTRNAVPAHRTAALHRAHEILATEQTLHVNIELAVNHAADKVDWLIVGMNYYYATLHFIVTTAVLVWLYVCHPDRYRSVRTTLYAATLLALAGFAFCATAPPRFLAGQGFVDTVVAHHTWGSWASGDVASLSNQYAAMPSVHIIWSTWSGLTLACLAHRTWVRVLGICYPLATVTVILATANHFVTDALAGVATLAVAFLLQRLLTGRRAYPSRRLPAGAAARWPSRKLPAAGGPLRQRAPQPSDPRFTSRRTALVGQPFGRQVPAYRVSGVGEQV